MSLSFIFSFIPYKVKSGGPRHIIDLHSFKNGHIKSTDEFSLTKMSSLENSVKTNKQKNDDCGITGSKTVI